MRTLHIVATAAALLVTASAPSFAASASRAHRGTDAYASGAVTTDRSGAYQYGPQGAPIVQDRTRLVEPPYNNVRGQNLPYPDRPYGAPDKW